MRKIISILMVLLLMASFLCGCSNTSGTEPTANGGNNEEVAMSDEKIKDEIVGAWVAEVDGSQQGYVFLEDGTGYATILPLTYNVEGGILNIKIEAFGQVETMSAKYNVSGDTLTLEKDGATIELKRTEMPEELENK